MAKGSWGHLPGPPNPCGRVGGCRVEAVGSLTPLIPMEASGSPSTPANTTPWAGGGEVCRGNGILYFLK